MDSKNEEPRIVYFSSATENTKRFVDKLKFDSERIPLRRTEDFLSVDYDYVLIVPTYGGGHEDGAVPKQVIKFLNDKNNRDHCVGVISSGNTNFGKYYGIASDIISSKLQVPTLYRFELLGTQEDREIVESGLDSSWSELVSRKKNS